MKYEPGEVNDADECPVAGFVLDAILETLPLLTEEQAAQQTRPVVDADEVAKRLGVSVDSIYKLVRQGKLEGYAVGRRKLIYVDTLDRYRKQNAFGKAEEPAPAPKQEPAPPKPRRRKPAATKIELPAKRHLT